MDSNTENRRKAVLAGHSGDYELANSLLTDDDPKVRGAALSSLEKLGMLSSEILENRPPRIEIDLSRSSRGVQKCNWALQIVIPLGILNDEDYLVVETACWAIGEKENPSLDLINKLCLIADSHEEQLCREAAVAALGSIGSPLGLETVLAALNDKPAIRRRAAIALAAFEDPKVDEALKKSLDDRDWQVRQIAEDLLDVNRVISPVDIGPRPD